MNKKLLYIFILTVLAISQSYSQAWSRYKYEGFYGLGATNFMGDIPAPTSEHPTGQFLWIHMFNTIGAAGNVGLRYNFEEKQYLTGTVTLGTFYGKDPTENPKYWDRGLEFRSFFTEFVGRYEYQIIQEKRKSTVYRKLGESRLKNLSVPTYIFIGAGATVSYGKLNEISGATVDSENYFNVAPVIPFGFGFKYKINRLTYINFEACWRTALSDKMDNASGKENARYGSWFDQYQTITINLIHKLRQNQNGTPKLKRL